MSPPSLPSSIGAEYTQPWRPGSSTVWATLELAPQISLHMSARGEGGVSPVSLGRKSIDSAHNIGYLARLDARGDIRLPAATSPGEWVAARRVPARRATVP